MSEQPRQAGKVEITEEMIEAGAAVLFEEYQPNAPVCSSRRDVVIQLLKEVFRAGGCLVIIGDDW